MTKHLFWPATLAAFAISAYNTCAFAGTPDNGELTPESVSLTYSAGPFNGSNAAATAGATCSETGPCDDFVLTVKADQAWLDSHPELKLQVKLSWPNDAFGAVPLLGSDYDIYLLDSNNNDLSAAGGATTNNPENFEVIIAGKGTSFTSQIVPYTEAGEEVTATLTLLSGQGEDNGGPASDDRLSLGGPKLTLYEPPQGFSGLNAAEPTIGINRQTDAVFMMLSLQQARISFDDSVTPATAVWDEISDPLANLSSADPFLADDPWPLEDGSYNPRIFIAQLQAANSIIGMSDDNGDSWRVSQGGGQPHGVDNQSIFAGPYPDGFNAPLGSAEHAFYYCSHSAVNAFCSRSDDSGLTFGPSVPIFPLQGLCNNHGHVRVGADGTVYVPMNNTCEGSQGVTLSVDAGQTWHFIAVPNTLRGRWDSSIAIASDGVTLYYAYGEEGDDYPRVIKGQLNKSDPSEPGIDWELPSQINVGQNLGLVNIAFSTLVAGDPDRVAYAFHATTKAGDSGDYLVMAGAEPALWHLYLAVSFDGGDSWQIQNLTPGDPTQIGAICDRGTTCADQETSGGPPDRNLLDFMGMAMDSEGRIVIGFADGCRGDACVIDGVPSYSNFPVVARQSSGKRLLAAFDPVVSDLPGATSLMGQRTLFGVALEWNEAPAGSSDTQTYRLERAVDDAAFETLATLAAGGLRKFSDQEAIDPEKQYHYRIAARNTTGQGDYSNVVNPQLPTESSCNTLGLGILTDPSGDVLQFFGPGIPQEAIDVIGLRVGQTQDSEQGEVLHFNLRMQDLNPLPQGVEWPIEFNVSNREINADLDPHFSAVMSTASGPSPVFSLSDESDGSDVPVSGAVFLDQGLIRFSVVASALGIEDDDLSKVSVLNFLTRILTGAIKPDNMPNDLTPAGMFMTEKAGKCRPNTPPEVVMTATPTRGEAPLMVNFDATASSDEDGDAISKFVFKPGDGTEHVKTSPQFAYQYAVDGTYGATLTLQDERGATASLPNFVQIVVAEAPPEASPTPGASTQPSPSPAPDSTPGSTVAPSPTPEVSATSTPATTASATPGTTPTSSAEPSPVLTATPASTASPAQSDTLQGAPLQPLRSLAAGEANVPIGRISFSNSSGQTQIIEQLSLNISNPDALSAIRIRTGDIEINCAAPQRVVVCDAGDQVLSVVDGQTMELELQVSTPALAKLAQVALFASVPWFLLLFLPSGGLSRRSRLAMMLLVLIAATGCSSSNTDTATPITADVELSLASVGVLQQDGQRSVIQPAQPIVLGRVNIKD